MRSNVATPPCTTYMRRVKMSTRGVRNSSGPSIKLTIEAKPGRPERQETSSGFTEEELLLCLTSYIDCLASELLWSSANLGLDDFTKLIQGSKIVLHTAKGSIVSTATLRCSTNGADT